MREPITVTYRAVHKNTPWRKVRGHASVESAVFGRKDGAPGLFDYKVRIDYKKHGEPLYAVIWEGLPQSWWVNQILIPSG